jgi:hypothetical protein
MIGVRTHSSPARRAVLGCVLVLGTLIGGGLTQNTYAARGQAVSASRPAATAFAVNPVTYHFAAQVVSGTGTGSIEGQVSGNLDTTGILTATLTLANNTTASVKGTVTSTAQLTVKGKAANATLTGNVLNKKAGTWGGTVATTANPTVGSWVLTPETQTITFALGGKSGTGSADKVALAGEVTLNLTADGWGDGNFAFLDNDTVLPVVGSAANGNMSATIFWPKNKGTVMVVATSKTTVGVLKWTGTFVGPAAGDFGTFLGEG